jgi:serine/threonine protein phosphatase PrpC
MRPPSDAIALVTFATAQGERDHQEDRAVHEWMECPAAPSATGWLLAVFDGHRGAECSDKASKSLGKMFEAASAAQNGNVPETLRDVFRSLNALSSAMLSGSTASVVFIPQDAQEAYAAVLGDSPIAILDAKGAVRIGPEHNVRTNLKERAAAESRGGIYQGGYLEDSDRPGVGLQMARSLGDKDLTRVLNREPEIQKLALGGRGIVLVGSDGLFSPGGGSGLEQLTEILGKIRKGGGADVVVKDALARQTGDNVTAVVWRKD